MNNIKGQNIYATFFERIYLLLPLTAPINV